mmetsp:Transcript_17119/g.45183  ORF Transcript_17119/g.45183 Transcript_17119/m.45183 type:complete len:222 (-) Transcript_17119:507-1172(-)
MTFVSSSRHRWARPDWWNGTLMLWRSRKNTASRAWIAHVQRSGEKSRGCFSPIGKLSSDLSGWSNRSTSSMIRMPLSKRRSPSASARASRSIVGWCLRRVSRSTSSFSRSLSCSDLIVAAVARTTPRLRTADCSLATVAHDSSDERSKESVKTRLRTMDEKVARSVDLDCSSSAGGIVCTTSRSPSPSMSARSGPTTVVLPPPISICLTSGWPERTAPMNS